MITKINDQTLTVFEMTGKDVLTFLNNQVVSELKQLSDSTRLTAICNPKGRILFTLILESHAETTYVAIDASLGDNFLQYINMRRFRMDVEINKSIKVLGINQQFEQLKLLDKMVFTADSELALFDAGAFWLFMFNAGLPWITSETSECFIPQHLNLDQLGVIDFDKGCYPGQEIVARLHFLGKVKKRMQYIQFQSEQQHIPNSKIQIPEFEQTVELCSPSILQNNKWHSQAIISI